MYVLLCVQCWTPDNGQRNCPKRVEFYSKNKFVKISASRRFYYKDDLELCAEKFIYVFMSRQKNSGQNRNKKWLTNISKCG